MQVQFTTPTGTTTVTCNRYERVPGEGVNGPHVLTFYCTEGEGEEAVERVCGGASRVIEFSEVEAEA